MRPYHLFVTQCLDRVERGGLPRWIKAEEDSDRGANKKCDHDRGGGNQRRPMSRQRDCFRSRDAEKDSENSPDRAKRNRFDQKLRENVAPVRAHGHARADFTRPLRYTDQHNIHDSNAANNERDTGDRAEQSGHYIGRGRGSIGDFLLIPDGEIIVATRANVMPLP